MRSAVICGLILLGGCGTKLPPLPAVDLSGAQAGVRGVVEPAVAAAKARPDDAAVVARLGMALHAHGQYASAAAAYERAAGLDGSSAVYLYYWGTALAADGKYAEAVRPLRAALQIRDDVPVRLRLADSLYSAGQVNEARREYSAVIAKDETSAAAQYGLGRCLQGSEAITAFQRAITRFPRYGAARFALAGIYRQQGKRAEAEAALENYERDKLVAPPMDDPAMDAVYALDASANGLLRQSQALERQGNLAGAAELQERALAADAKLVQAWVNLISVYGRMGERGKAEAAYLRAVALEPKNAEAHYNFGVLCAESERYDEARAAFQKAVDNDPRHAEALDSLGAMVEMTGAWDRAAELYRRALAARQDLRLAHYHLGRILANQRKYREAIAEFEKAIQAPIDERTPGYMYALGATHARAGDREASVLALQRAQLEAQRWRQGGLADAIQKDLAKLTRR